MDRRCMSRGGHEMQPRVPGLPGEKICVTCDHYEVDLYAAAAAGVKTACPLASCRAPVVKVGDGAEAFYLDDATPITPHTCAGWSEEPRAGRRARS